MVHLNGDQFDCNLQAVIGSYSQNKCTGQKTISGG